MIRTVEYHKVPPRFGMAFREVYGDIANFVFAVRQIMESDGNVLLVMEPGDATHYEFLIIQCGDNLAIAAPERGWSVLSGIVGVTPGYIESKTGLKINAFTLGVICQVIHDVYNPDSKEVFYDWEKALPVGIVRPGDEVEDTDGGPS